ncbi:MAG: hypothetical protein LAP61_05615 [Acidobacteriia bacterium]|nr:hypothetical protein [Terriglobia bacterium]
MALPLNKISGMPRVGAAFAGWQNKIELLKRSQTVVDGLVQSIDSPFSFTGVMQPLSPNQIELKPEGQRAFEWLQIHCTSGPLNLDPNDRIFFNEKLYKIMAQNDYSLNGYIEYHAIQDSA